MTLLLDTHVILWAAYQPERLSAAARALLLDPAHQLCFSVASLWEVAIKRALDRPDFTAEPRSLRAGLLRNGYEELPITGRHCLAVAALPPLHRDPFDRMLIAQSIAEGLTLVTADQRMADYEAAIRRI
ncbi:MAG: type II toxin-antitoxin system VapC family toxin [Pseudomonadota bacterium]